MRGIQELSHSQRAPGPGLRVPAVPAVLPTHVGPLPIAVEQFCWVYGDIALGLYCIITEVSAFSYIYGYLNIFCKVLVQVFLLIFY